MIFNMYMLYQQHVLGRLRTLLSGQMEIAAEQRARAEAFDELSILDPLTGLFNRRFCEGRMPSEIARAEGGYPLVLLLLDLDNFKGINTYFGYSAGDLVLKEFARQLTNAIRGSDIAMRLGGDDFLVILVDCKPEKVDTVLSRIRDFEIETGNFKIPVSSSRGWAQYELGDTSEDLFKRACEALHANKAMHLTHALQL
jgi:two-component system cell cycle response regulator